MVSDICCLDFDEIATLHNTVYSHHKFCWQNKMLKIAPLKLWVDAIAFLTVAALTKRMQIADIVGATLRQRNDVIHF
ncbi:hypothetical protein C1752_00940 [Acaryochloris thomasi RCC1774]|uniref:Uncharacterized protein n=1 Tax=Acaryochloris thomasi RCC1774 TaxID=1764569 RepID=A0A2W1JNM5_9CYAN|nr:hypothetical protein C1752_00940 [Acaryochloris thomasi RCC1774]